MNVPGGNSNPVLAVPRRSLTLCPESSGKAFAAATQTKCLILVEGRKDSGGAFVTFLQSRISEVKLGWRAGGTRCRSKQGLLRVWGSSATSCPALGMAPSPSPSPASFLFHRAYLAHPSLRAQSRGRSSHHRVTAYQRAVSRRFLDERSPLYQLTPLPFPGRFPPRKLLLKPGALSQRGDQ